MTLEGVAIRAAALVGGLAALLVLGGPGIRSLDREFGDWVTRQAADARPQQRSAVTVVEIDDASIAALGRFPWSRDRFARFLEVTRVGGAEVVALDVLFIERADRAADSAFVAAVAAADNVVLAAARAPAGSGIAFLEPFDSLAAAARGLGNIAVDEDADGTLRRYPFLTAAGDDVYPSLAYAMLEVLEVEEARVPLEADGSLLVNFAAMPPSALERVSFSQVLEWSRGEAARAFQDRPVLVAANYTGGVDVGPTPLGPRTPSGYVHAYALETILSGRYLRVVPGWLPLFAAAGLLVLLAHPALATPLRLGLGVLAGAGMVLVGSWALLRWGGTYLPPALPVAALVLFGGLRGLLAWRLNLAGRQRAEAFLRRFVGAKVERRLDREPTARIHSQRVELTVLFCDLCDFTNYTNQAAAEEVVDVLRTFGQMALDTIVLHGGVVDKLLGDGIMAFWGYPNHAEDHPGRAVAAALALQIEMDAVNEALVRRGIRSFQVRVGLSTGPVTLGEIGGEALADFTAIGRHVNLAARLQESAPPGGVLMTATTRERASDAAGSWVERREPLTVRGFDAPVQTYLAWARKPESWVTPFRTL